MSIYGKICNTLFVTVLFFLSLSSCTQQSFDNFRANWDTDPYSETFNNTNYSALGFYIGEKKFIQTQTRFFLSINTDVLWNIDSDGALLSVYSGLGPIGGSPLFNDIVNDKIYSIHIHSIYLCLPYDESLIDTPIHVNESNGNHIPLGLWEESMEDNTTRVITTRDVLLNNLVIEYSSVIKDGRVAGTFSADLCLDFDFLNDSPVLHIERGIFNLLGSN